jgi:antitoxin (DNA-binding transcriptional repressor) of toxin-antitoxin stability system
LDGARAAPGYNGLVEKATISQLKNRLSAYLRKVRAGATILIVDRDEPIARIERLEAGRPDDRTSRLERAGLVRRRSAPLRLSGLRAPAPRPRRSVVEALVDDRREGR